MQSLEVMKDVPVTEKKPAAAAPAAPAAPAAAGVAPVAPAPVAAPVKKTERKKVTVQKATTCDLCTDLSMPSCVYACPHDAAKRVEPARFLAAQIGVSAKSGRRFSWLSGPADRTTH
jgi:Fe-S-cluster-containing hydrogenase component 2